MCVVGYFYEYVKVDHPYTCIWICTFMCLFYIKK